MKIVRRSKEGAAASKCSQERFTVKHAAVFSPIYMSTVLIAVSQFILQNSAEKKAHKIFNAQQTDIQEYAATAKLLSFTEQNYTNATIRGKKKPITCFLHPTHTSYM